MDLDKAHELAKAGKRMKYLTVCNYGNVRSVAFARELKAAGHEAIAVGYFKSSKDTFRYMVEWADKVINLMEDPGSMRGDVPNHKYINMQIGEDVWWNPFHPELKRIAKIRLEDMLSEL